MRELYEQLGKALKHLEVLHRLFANEDNFQAEENLDHKIYAQNEGKLRESLNKLNLSSQLYGRNGRQMILADFLEYILLGRGYYSIRSTEDKQNFVRTILYLVNLLMCYETLTVSNNLRKTFLDILKEEIPTVSSEEHYEQLRNFTGKVGLTDKDSDADRSLNKYFDSILPKTAGGLWNELLSYVFLLRSNVGYIIPLLLSQRLIALNSSIIPPDFLIITHDKRLYGIEVGTKKEIQSGSFSLRTAIPTATFDTERSRMTDRCPICKKWASSFCDFAVENYSSFGVELARDEIRCLDDCNLYSEEEIAAGECLYTKYSRGYAKTKAYARHKYANGYHYHYRCVLENLPSVDRDIVIEAKDRTALKMHYPYYSGLEELLT